MSVEQQFYPRPHSNTLNMVGDDDGITALFAAKRAVVQDLVRRGELTEDAFDALIHEERQVRTEHNTGQRLLGCTVLNAEVLNEEGQRFKAAWEAGDDIAVEGVSVLQEHWTITDSLSTIFYPYGEVVPASSEPIRAVEFADMLVGSIVGQRIVGAADTPMLLIPADRVTRHPIGS
jgi:hypothetical protein